MPGDASSKDFEARAAHRRATWSGGVARSFAELDDRGLDFWVHADSSTKFQAMWDAIVEAWVVSGKHGPPPRFQGSTFGIGRFER